MYMNVHLFFKNVKYYYYVDPSPVKVHLLKHTVCDISQTLMHDKLLNTVRDILKAHINHLLENSKNRNLEPEKLK